MAHLDMAEREADGRGGCVQALVRALALLDSLALHDHGLTLSEAARRVELPRSTAHRLLTTMEAMGYVAFNPGNNQWTVGVRAMAIGRSATDGDDLVRLARPVLQWLVLQARLAASVAAPAGRDVRYLGHARPPGDRSPLACPGDLQPIHTTATGKAIMSCWSDAELAAFLRAAPLEAATAFSITDPATLGGEIDLVRRRGYALDDRETHMGLRCVAAPVRDRDGRVRAAICVSGPMRQLADGRAQALGAQVQHAARRMAEGFGLVAAA